MGAGRGLNVRDMLTSRLSARFSVVEVAEFDLLVEASCARETESERERAPKSEPAVVDETEADLCKFCFGLSFSLEVFEVEGLETGAGDEERLEATSVLLP